MPAVNEISEQPHQAVASPVARIAKPRKLVVRLEDADDASQNPIVEISTAVIVSTLLHVVVLIVFATWYISNAENRDDFVLNSSVNEANEKIEIDNPVNVRLDRSHKNITNKNPEKVELLSSVLTKSKSLPKSDLQQSLFGTVSTANGRGTKGASGSTNLFGSGKEANSYVFIVDCSDSMNQGRRFYLAKRELQKTVANLSARQKFFIFFYNHDTYPMKPLRGRSSRRMVKATKKNKQAALVFVGRIQAWGMTQPAKSLELALKMKPEVIYFLTDGEIPSDTPFLIKQNNNQKTIVNTVALGLRGSEMMMRNIAKENRGHYRFVGEPGAVASPGN